MGREYLADQLGAKVLASRVKRTIRCISGTLPVGANLFRWKMAPTAGCRLCRADHEGFTHVQCWCPKLKEARIKGHHMIWREIVSALEEFAEPTYQFFTEMRMENLKSIMFLDMTTYATALAEWAQAVDKLNDILASLPALQITGKLSDIVSSSVHARCEVLQDPDTDLQTVLRSVDFTQCRNDIMPFWSCLDSGHG